MKMLIAIVNHDDAHKVMQELMQNGFSITKLSTTGGFLRAGNVTMLIGSDEQRVDDALKLIADNCQKRKQVIPTTAELGLGVYPTMPIEVTVGGATVFIMDIERFEKF